jgi:two-component system, OmpR family, KDP operon response regulator KdpE
MASKKRILVIDDDPVVVRLLGAILQPEGFALSIARDGQEGLAAFERENPSLIILDIMMPVMDGFEVCRRVREISQVPIIMLSTVTVEEEKVTCLNLGADDYVTKPFGVEEIKARIRAVLRRSEFEKGTSVPSRFVRDDLEISFAQHKVFVKEKEIRLTPTEFALLQELTVNAGKVLTYTHLLHKVWGSEYEGEHQYLHVFMGRLRSKIEADPVNPKYIATLPGIGYEFRA